MTKILNCDCGRVVRGDSDDELVAAAQEHAREAHGIELTREQVLSWWPVAARVSNRHPDDRRKGTVETLRG